MYISYIISLNENFNSYMKKNRDIKSPPLKNNKTMKMKPNHKKENNVPNSTHKLMNSKMNNTPKGSKDSLIISKKVDYTLKNEKHTKGKIDSKFLLQNQKTIKRNTTIKQSKFKKLQINLLYLNII